MELLSFIHSCLRLNLRAEIEGYHFEKQVHDNSKTKYLLLTKYHLLTSELHVFNLFGYVLYILALLGHYHYQQQPIIIIIIISLIIIS